MGNLEVSLRLAFQGFEADVWTALPGILKSFNATAITAVVQPSIQAQIRQPDGTWNIVNLPVCLDCPVIFSSGGGYASSMPLAQGDEGLLVFASRCIDGWWQQGGIQNQAELRMHDLSDGFFIPGCFSQPKAGNFSGGVNTSEAQLRSLDGTVMVRVNKTSKQAGLVAASTSLVMDGVANRCDVIASAGLWVNGVQVIVP